MSKRKPPNAGVGRKKGNPNKVTKRVREIVADLVESNIAKAQLALDRVEVEDPARFVELVVKLAEFVLPKLNRTELAAEVTPIKPPNLGISFDLGGPGRTRIADYSVENDVAALEKLPPGADFLPGPDGKNEAPMPAPYPTSPPLQGQPRTEFIQGERPLLSKHEMWAKLGEPLKGPR